MSLILTHGYFLEEDMKEKKIMKPYPPLGLLYVSSYLNKQGIKHDVFDTTFESFSSLCIKLETGKYTQVALYVNLMTKLNVLRIIKFIRQSESLKQAYIILGGPDVRYNAERYIEAGADIAVIGEGEATMTDLINTLNTPMNPFLDQVDGIAFKNFFGKVIFNKEREKIKDIDELPFPNRAAVPMDKYFRTWKKTHGKSAISISTQRGCPYTCNWCSTAVYGQSYRRRSPASVCDEIEVLIREYKADTFWFVDDVFTVSHRWLAEFADEVGRRRLRIRYECITRADRVDMQVIHNLKRSGCFRVWIGAESGSQQVIDDMDRRVDVKQVRYVLRLASTEGLETGTFIMLGYPGETEKDIMETVEHLVLSNPSQFTVTLAYPIRGTGLFDKVKDRLIGIDNWEMCTDRDLDFQRTYSRGYYDYAIRFVVNEVKYRTLPKWLRLFNPLAWKYRLKSLAAQDGMIRYKNKQ